MRNRWFHVPKLHSPGLGLTKKATWLELFYDLIFVAAFIQLGNGLSEHVSLEGFIAFAALFAPLWFVWTGFTYYVNRFTVDDFSHRLLVFVQMFAVGAMAVTGPEVLSGRPHAFAFAFAVAQAMVAGMYLRAWIQVSEARDYARYWGTVFGLGAAVWLVSGFVPAPACYGLWAVGVATVFSSPFSRQSRTLSATLPLDAEHLSERYGLLTIIVLGESFVKVLSSLAGGGAEITLILQASLTLALICCIWWIYFDDVAGSHIRGARFAPVIWLYAHLPLHIGITATGVAVKKAVHFDLSTVAADAYRWLLAGSLGLTLLSVAIIDSVTERRQAELSDRARVNMRFASGILMLLLAPAGAGMDAGLFLALVMAMFVAQVIFDMMMAPLDAEPEHPDEAPMSAAEVARRRAQGEEAPPVRPVRPGVLDAVRKGTPSEMRRDLYFYFMEGSWPRLMIALAFVYVVVNVFFAALYLLEPGAIGNARADSFADAFFFSVQTLSTIGYGAMAPQSDYGHAVVTIEAAVGLLGVALATGLMFAKASRPRASVLFSRPIVLTRMNGKPTLIFRAGNARGNEVVDASVTLTVLKDETSPEGVHMRRMYDLTLVRSRTPMFLLSWVIMHPIDEDSPLHDVDWAQPEQSGLLMLTVTLMGHDGTYGQTIYSRHYYLPEHIRVGHRLVDVLGHLPDGRIVVDYSRFHDTEPDGQEAVA